MKLLVMNLALALAWALVTARPTAGNFVMGFAVGYVALRLAYRAIGARRAYFGGLLRLLRFVAFFLWELLLANLRVAYAVVMPRRHMRPGVVGVPLDVRTDAQITLLANLITLTPGTLSLDVSADRRTLYLHVIHLRDPDALRRSIKQGLERRVLEMTQP